MREQKSLKPQDVLVLLYLLTRGKEDPIRQIDLAYALKLSQSEIGLALNRLTKSQLLTQSKIPIKAAAEEFLIHGLKYVFPAEPGALTRGVPTAHSAKPLSDKFQSPKSDGYVWPDPNGTSRGQGIEPLYKSASQVAKNEPRIYELLALIDSLRVGRARESNIAIEEIRRRINEAQV